MKPIIGICCTYIDEERLSGIKEGYYSAIEEIGGIPILLPVVEKEETLDSYIEMIDGLLLSGGVDVDPSYYGENPIRTLGRIDPMRDRNELYLAAKAMERGKSILGICRGIQILAVANGGSVIQDIPTQIPDSLQHMQNAPRWYGTHKVSLLKESLLYKIYGQEEITTNSFHHQSVQQEGKDFVITAKTVEGVIEAIEHKNHKFTVGVQWHPELMWKKDEKTLELFKDFVNSCIE